MCDLFTPLPTESAPDVWSIHPLKCDLYPPKSAPDVWSIHPPESAAEGLFIIVFPCILFLF